MNTIGLSVCLLCVFVIIMAVRRLERAHRRPVPVARRELRAVPFRFADTNRTTSEPESDQAPAPVVIPGDHGPWHPPPPPRPRYKPRPPGEWDGMLVDLATTPPCLDGVACGLARACVDGICTACAEDSQCRGGEVCVLDHCLLKARAECRSSFECGADAKCILSGYSAGPRGNEDMTAACVSANSGRGKTSIKTVAAPSNAAGDSARRVRFDEEMNRARAVNVPR